MLRLVGRLQGIQEAIGAALTDTPNEDMHTIDLLGSARELTHRAVMHAWTLASQLGDEGDENANTGS
jgi:hypothetical protein